MKLLIAAVGKAKPSPEQQLYADYMKRMPWKSELRELEVKLEDAAQRRKRESEWLLQTCQQYAKRISLDESGKLLSSREFAQMLGTWQQQGHSSYAFIIGGSDGLEEDVLRQSHLVWSLGRVTWPHMLVRALLAEQLYRASTILNGHPYHRE